MVSADGSQRSSPRAALAPAGSIAALISPRGAAPDVAVEGPNQLEAEVVGAIQGVGIDAVGHVLGAVVVRGDERAVGEAGDRGRAELGQARRERVGPEAG